MLYSFDYYKLDRRNHKFKIGDVYVYEGNTYKKHISKITFSCNQTINSQYMDFINPKNCRLANADELELFKKSHKKYILL